MVRKVHHVVVTSAMWCGDIEGEGQRGGEREKAKKKVYSSITHDHPLPNC
jgi:hypothetical protein